MTSPFQAQNIPLTRSLDTYLSGKSLIVAGSALFYDQNSYTFEISNAGTCGLERRSASQLRTFLLLLPSSEDLYTRNEAVTTNEDVVGARIDLSFETDLSGALIVVVGIDTDLIGP